MRKITFLALAALAGLAAPLTMADDSFATVYKANVPEGFDFKLIDQRPAFTGSDGKTKYDLFFENHGTEKLTIDGGWYGYYTWSNLGMLDPICGPFGSPSYSCLYYCYDTPTVTIEPGEAQRLYVCSEGGPSDRTDLFTASFYENGVTKRTVEFAAVVNDVQTCSNFAADENSVLACLREGDSISNPYPPPPPVLTNVVYHESMPALILNFDKPVTLADDWNDGAYMDTHFENMATKRIKLDNSSRLLLNNGTLIWVDLDLPRQRDVLSGLVHFNSGAFLHDDGKQSLGDIYRSVLFTNTQNTFNNIDYETEPPLSKKCSMQILSTSAYDRLYGNIVLSFNTPVQLTNDWHDRVTVNAVHRNGTDITINPLNVDKVLRTLNGTLLWFDLSFADMRALRSVSEISISFEPETFNTDYNLSINDCLLDNQLTIPLTVLP